MAGAIPPRDQCGAGATGDRCDEREEENTKERQWQAVVKPGPGQTVGPHRRDGPPLRAGHASDQAHSDETESSDDCAPPIGEHGSHQIADRDIGGEHRNRTHGHQEVRSTIGGAARSSDDRGNLAKHEG